MIMMVSDVLDRLKVGFRNSNYYSESFFHVISDHTIYKEAQIKNCIFSLRRNCVDVCPPVLYSHHFHPLDKYMEP